MPQEQGFEILRLFFFLPQLLEFAPLLEGVYRQQVHGEWKGWSVYLEKPCHPRCDSLMAGFMVLMPDG